MLWLDNRLYTVLFNEDAVKCGYTEPTYAKIDGWEIKGKSIDCYHMRFAAIRKGE